MKKLSILIIFMIPVIFLHCQADQQDLFQLELFKGNLNEATQVRKNFSEKYPEMTLYLTWKSPFGHVRIGKCGDKETVLELQKKFIHDFPKIKVLPCTE